MKTSTKWILGILIGLVVVAVLVALGFFAFGSWDRPGMIIGPRAFRYWEDRGEVPFPRMPMRPERMMPMVWFGVSPWRMFAGSLLWLGLFVLIVLGVITLAHGLRRPAQAVVAPVQSISPARACPNCDRPLQPDWVHCPYCGHDLQADLSVSPAETTG